MGDLSSSGKVQARDRTRFSSNVQCGACLIIAVCSIIHIPVKRRSKVRASGADCMQVPNSTIRFNNNGTLSPMHLSLLEKGNLGILTWILLIEDSILYSVFASRMSLNNRIDGV
jgi:hypothetical protein